MKFNINAQTIFVEYVAFSSRNSTYEKDNVFHDKENVVVVVKLLANTQLTRLVQLK